MIVTGTLVVLMVLAVLGAALPALANTSVDAKVTQVTGLAADTSQNVWWATDSSGTIQAIGSDGAVQGELTLDVTPTSVQALTMRGGRLFVGDIGDAARSRQAVDVYAVTFPAVGSATTKKYELVYPDGAHDAAAMTVSPNGRIYVITCGDNPGIYRTSTTPTSGGITNELTRTADAPEWVTDAVYTTDGTDLVLRTLNSVIVYDGETFTRQAAAKLADGASGQALAHALSGTGLVTANQSTPVQLVATTVPTTLVDVGTAPSPSTASSGSASPSASASAAATDSTASTANRSGTFWALVGAGLLSLLAAGIVAFKR